MLCYLRNYVILLCVMCANAGQGSSEQSLLREYMTSWKYSKSSFKPFVYRMFNQYLLH